MRSGGGTGSDLAMHIVEATAKILGENERFAEAGVAGAGR